MLQTLIMLLFIVLNQQLRLLGVTIQSIPNSPSQGSQGSTAYRRSKHYLSEPRQKIRFMCELIVFPFLFYSSRLVNL